MTWIFLLLLCFLGVREEGSEPGACDGTVIIELAPDGLPPLEHARLSAALMDDADDLLAQIMAWRDASKPALEPLIKQYMRSVERLMQLSAGSSDERQRLSADTAVFEAQTYAILERYRLQIRGLLASHTLKRREMAAVSLPMRLDGMSPGRYRVHVILTVETTQFHWFEPIQLQGGDRLAIRLTRENVKNPDWTDFNWWSFMNLDFSKHHQIP